MHTRTRCPTSHLVEYRVPGPEQSWCMRKLQICAHVSRNCTSNLPRRRSLAYKMPALSKRQSDTFLRSERFRFHIIVRGNSASAKSMKALYAEVKTAKLAWRVGFQQRAPGTASQSARGGLHCTKLNMLPRMPKMVMSIILDHRNLLLHFAFGPKIRSSSKDTEILVSGKTKILKGWTIQFHFKTWATCSGVR